MRTTRRGFLKHVGAGTAGTCLSPLLPWPALAQGSVRRPYDPHLKQHFPSVCRQCPAGCGVLAEVVRGRVKKLRGNPLHPTNRGTLCARGFAARQLYYNPDRIRTPLRRTGARGAAGWEPVSWDDAFAVIGERLRALREAGRPHALALLADQLSGLEGLLAERFCEAFGTPNAVDLSQYPSDGVMTAARVMQGVPGPVIFDLARASIILSFNVPFLSTSRNLVQTARQFAAFRSGKAGARGRLVHFSPVRDLTAAKADEWVPIAPGTEGAVALGMAYVLIQEGLYDHDFVKYHTQGFEKSRAGGTDIPGFHQHVRRNYKPARVADISGVPVDKIVSLAREFALGRAPLALWEEQAGIATQPLSTQMAIHSLNALAGNIDVPGGVLVPRALPDHLPGEVVRDGTSRDGFAHGALVSSEHTQFTVPGPVRSTFPQRVVLGAPYPVDLLLVYRANPVFDELNGTAYAEALQKIPFSVCCASFHNETTRWCDLILPESHAVEAWHAGVNYTDDGHPFFNLCEPVLAPRHDTRHFGDVVLGLAQATGGTVAESLPWPRFPAAAFAYLDRVNALQAGDVFGQAYEEIWTRLLERIGWRARVDDSTEAFWTSVVRAGGWWDPIYYHKEWERSLRTPSGRFEFFPKVLWDALRRVRKGGTITDEDTAAILPHYLPAPAAHAPEEYPFTLLVYALPHLSLVESANQPWLQEIAGWQEREQWGTWLDINPEDAHRYHLRPGTACWLESARGRARVRCRLDHGVPPHTVRVPFGLGHTAGGRWMRDIGVSPTAVVQEAYDPRSGVPNWQTTRVRLRKA